MTAVDRRITGGDRVISDEYDKTTAFWTEDAQVAVSFAGLAKVQTFNTLNWLRSALADLGAPDFSIAGVVPRLTNKLTEEFRINPQFSSLPRPQRRLSIMLAGYKFRPGEYLPIYAIISNFERPGLSLPPAEEAYSEFSFACGHLKDGEECVTVAIGDVAKLEKHRDRVIKLRSEATSLKSRAVGLRLVHAIRLAAFQGQPLSTIGSQIYTFEISPSVGSPILSHYHNASHRRRNFMPGMVVSTRNTRLAVSDISVAPVDDRPLPSSVSPVARNRLCPCGSGKKYKRCHGAKYC